MSRYHSFEYALLGKSFPTTSNFFTFPVDLSATVIRPTIAKNQHLQDNVFINLHTVGYIGSL